MDISLQYLDKVETPIQLESHAMPIQRTGDDDFSMFHSKCFAITLHFKDQW